MTALRPCSRHTAAVWIASCADCTAWHLEQLRHRREASTTAATPPPQAA